MFARVIVVGMTGGTGRFVRWIRHRCGLAVAPMAFGAVTAQLYAVSGRVCRVAVAEGHGRPRQSDMAAAAIS